MIRPNGTFDHGYLTPQVGDISDKNIKDLVMSCGRSNHLKQWINTLWHILFGFLQPIQIALDNYKDNTVKV